MSSKSPEISTNEDNMDITFTKRGCCFWMPCLTPQRASTVGSNLWQRIRTVDHSTTNDDHDPWWVRGWKRLRDWSEIIAGPKWKTFIRSFNKNHPGNGGVGCVGVGGGGGGGGGGSKHGQFQYDPLSYSLNFDEGPGRYGNFYDNDFMNRDFSSRYASLPASSKCSMDLGKDAPSFT